ncbi:putative protein kinase [Lyophyllum shimeji]|uniref:Protein kinase domain-containing protein n=1 Tax=Lyophyllum shimeji TaxID=47721 RepID=A0A9P3PET3_LYOSH|nr:putative protein kinase [Lyophyllum shimeji]
MSSQVIPSSHSSETAGSRSTVSSTASSSSSRPGLRSHNLAVHLRQLYRFQTFLREHEEPWRDRYAFLLSKGYQLRARYEPDWSPSWLTVDIDPAYCDDVINSVLHMVLDAERLVDGTTVCIKRINPETVTDEVKIAKYLSSAEMLCDSKNHCVPIWDSFRDPTIPKVEYIIMPPLRPFDDPEFGAVGEVVDFVTQMIEGMVFMHRHLVAHGDLTTPNIMMDARPILPTGWHFVAQHRTPDGVTPISPLARIDHPVRYIIIDFDCAVRLSEDQPHLITDFGGRDGDPRNIKDFYQKYEGLDFLASLIDFMKTADFRQRPDAEMALQYWLSIRAHVDIGKARWRLQKRKETIGERVLYDTVAFAKEGVHRVKHMLTGGERRVYWS